jgi:hypothetical protein
MIWPTLGRILGVIFAFVLAVVAAAITLFFLGARWAAQEAVAHAPDTADEMSFIVNEWFGVMAFFMTVTPLLTLLPGVAVAVVGEVARIRSALYYIFASGAAAALMPVLSAPADVAASPSYSTEYFAIIATAGFAGGLVYWLIAGRNA